MHHHQCVTVRTALCVPLLVPVIVTEVVLVTALVVTVNAADVLPDAIVTLEGTVATAVLLLERVTTVPPEGAGPEIVTVPAEGEPPLTEEGFNVTELATGA